MRQQQYHHPALKQLSQQVRFTPVERRLEQLNRAERLLAEISPAKSYPYQFVCFRITGYRPESYPQLLIAGKDLDHDLTRFIQEVSATVPAVPIEEVPEPVLTLEQLSDDLKVSSKTISRWRDRGLASRRVLLNGRCKVGIRKSLLDRFLAQHHERVERSSRFTQLDELQKADILRRAKRMARVAPDKFTEICRRIAKKLNRSPETIRYTIKKHDQMDPRQAIFPNQNGPLDLEAKQAIYASYRRGISVDALAKRFDRTSSSVHRVINEMRAKRLLDVPLDYIDHPSFHDEANELEIMALMPDALKYEAAQAKALASVPKGVPPELAPMYEVPLLGREQEAHLFRQMNYLKHQASALRGRIDPARARSSDLDRLESLIKQAQELKEKLIRANMRLVASIAKKHTGPTDNIFELISDGNVSLMRAVEKFDFSRGNKFSTYASWAIMKNYARSVPEEKTRRNRFMTGQEELFDLRADTRTNEQEEEADVRNKREAVQRLLSRLDERERRIIMLRFGMEGVNPNGRGLTLEQVGEELGITTERVRQLEARTKAKLLSLAREERVEMP